MEFAKKSKLMLVRKKREPMVVAIGADNLRTYPYSVNLYSVPPLGDVDLEEAEDMVAERINILKVFDKGQASPNMTKSDREEFMTLLESRLNGAQSRWSPNLYKGCTETQRSLHLPARERDHVSHFLLRLYYCRSEELRKWFVWHETELLRMRLFHLSKGNEATIAQVLQANNLQYDTVSEEEKIEKKLLYGKVNWDSTMAKSSFSTQVLYKLKFTDALELVRHRKVYIEKGYAYVLQSEMVSIVLKYFRVQLNQCLARMVRDLPTLEEDERLLPRLHTIHFENVTKVEKAARDLSATGNKEPVTPDMVDDLAKESFPPCMRSIHETLRKNHHLKHYGRLHYGLFLKSVGMNLDDALTFFREEFIKGITPEKFQKEYAYNIRYNYGKEGKRTSMSGYACAKIISDNPPGPGDTHGCPFRHFDTSNLKTTLRRYGANEETLGLVLEQVEAKSFTSACTCFFNSKHPNYELRVKEGRESGINHPNQYFTESRRAIRGVGIEEEMVARSQVEGAEGGGEMDTVEQFDDEDESFLKTFTEEQLLAGSQSQIACGHDGQGDNVTANAEEPIVDKAALNATSEVQANETGTEVEAMDTDEKQADE